MNLEEGIREVLIKTCQGNPGALKVLMALMEANTGSYMARLFMALELTESRSSNLWIVHKDLCEFDLDKTKAMLEEWFDSSSASLGHWLRAVKDVQYAEVPE